MLQRPGGKTDAILKYKPTVLTVALPYRLANFAEQRDETDDAKGYHLRMRWRDPIQGHNTRLVAFIPPQVPPGELAERFPLEQPSFMVRSGAIRIAPDRSATFVAYNNKPEHIYVLGVHPLRNWTQAAVAKKCIGDVTIDARQVQAHAALLLRGTAQSPPNLTDISQPSRWEAGEMRGLFPSDVAWSPQWMCWAARRTGGTLAVCIGPSAGSIGGIIPAEPQKKKRKRTDEITSDDPTGITEPFGLPQG